MLTLEGPLKTHNDTRCPDKNPFRRFARSRCLIVPCPRHWKYHPRLGSLLLPWPKGPSPNSTCRPLGKNAGRSKNLEAQQSKPNTLWTIQMHFLPKAARFLWTDPNGHVQSSRCAQSGHAADALRTGRVLAAEGSEHLAHRASEGWQVCGVVLASGAVGVTRR